MSNSPFRLRPITSAEVIAMVEAGILDEHEPVELIGGQLVRLAPKSPIRCGLVASIHRDLQRHYGHRVYVQCFSSIDAGPCALPEPALAVVRGQPLDAPERHPTGSDTLLVAEVADSGVDVARAKAAVYAGAGAPVYWLIDVKARRLEVYSEPLASGDYALTRLLGDTDEVPLPGLDGVTLPVAELLP